jgi:hypothetical protein
VSIVGGVSDKIAATTPIARLGATGIIDTISEFGASVALNSTYALVGDHNAATGASGRAYLYQLGATGDLSPIATLGATGISDTISNFGYSVALNSTYALVGDPDAAGSVGRAYLYQLGATGDLSPIARLGATGISDTTSSFGISVALNSTYALVGDLSAATGSVGRAYLYQLGATGNLSPIATLGATGISDIINEFGASVALNSTYALVGDNSAATGSRGRAYLYQLGAYREPLTDSHTRSHRHK